MQPKQRSIRPSIKLEQVFDLILVSLNPVCNIPVTVGGGFIPNDANLVSP